ncbi:MAG: NRAMP family divalent metal transporter [Candidatus Bathyarchaeia archaeon]|jgi:NRAMP (natural resistance-associated macrophage protein)-like metal ion transporter
MNQKVSDWLRNFGPAWIVMIADVDVASIITGLQAGATWGYRMIFILTVLIFPLFIIQDAAGRLGIASGKGLGEQIRNNFGKKAAVMAAIPMGLSDFLEYVAQYAGIAIGFALIGFPVILGLIIVFGIHTLIIFGRQYHQAEKMLIPVSFLLMIAIVSSTFVFHVNFGLFVSLGLSPLQPYGNPSFAYLLAASVGAVIMPWMLYFHSGADSRRHKQVKDLKNERLETLIGAVVSEILMIILVVVGLNVFSGDKLINVSELTKALPVFGSYAEPIMGLGFIFAGFLALVVVSLGSAWGVLEATGRSSGPNSRANFLEIYALEAVPAIVIVAVVSGYIQLMLNMMFIFPLVLIPSLYFLGRLVTKKEVMNGNQFKKYEKIAFWAAALIVVAGGLLGIFSLL